MLVVSLYLLECFFVESHSVVFAVSQQVHFNRAPCAATVEMLNGRGGLRFGGVERINLVVNHHVTSAANRNKLQVEVVALVVDVNQLYFGRGLACFNFNHVLQLLIIGVKLHQNKLHLRTFVS